LATLSKNPKNIPLFGDPEAGMKLEPYRRAARGTMAALEHIANTLNFYVVTPLTL